MAGHSKWINTKYRKAAQDVKRGKIFTKIIRELVTASRLGGKNLTINPRLRSAINKALSNNMNRDTLNRAVERGVGSEKNVSLKTIIYEGYGPGGTAIMVECLSDNRNRTIAEVRQIFSKNDGNLGVKGSVSYLFQKKGILLFEKGDEETMLNVALELGAEDLVTRDNGIIEIYSSLEKIEIIQNTLKMSGEQVGNVEITMIPSIKRIIDEKTAQKLIHFIHMLENYKDTKKVYHNGEI